MTTLTKTILAVVAFTCILGVIESAENVSVSDAIFRAPTCIMYGECSENPDLGHKLNCPDNGRPRNMNESATTQILRSNCPNMFNPDQSLMELCCDRDQVLTMGRILHLAQMSTGGNKACLSEIKALACNLACSPAQNYFMRVTEFDVDVQSNKSFVKAIQTFVHPNLFKRFLNACRDNEMVMYGVCGKSGEHCDYLDIASFMGAPTNPFSPFTIDFTVTEEIVLVDNSVFQPLDPEEPSFTNFQRLYSCLKAGASQINGQGDLKIREWEQLRCFLGNRLDLMYLM